MATTTQAPGTPSITSVGAPMPGAAELPAPSPSPAPPAAPTWTSQELTDLMNLARREGDVARMRRGWLLSHPDAVRDLLVTHDRCFGKTPALQRARFTLGNGLLTNDGDTYRRQRALIQPSLHPRRLSGYADVMARHAAEAADGWGEGQTIDVHREMMRVTLKIVAEALFGTPVGPEVHAISRAMDFNVGMFKKLVSPWGRLKVLLPTPYAFRFLLARRQLLRTLRRFVAERRASGERRDDLLARLIAARDGEASGEGAAVPGASGSGGSGAGMSERQLIDECVTLFTAGHETTANALTFTLRLVAQHPAVEARLHEEVDRVLGAPAGDGSADASADRRLPGADDLDALIYTRMVVAESMRLFPPAWIVGRQAKEPCDVNGRPVRRGEVLFASQWVIHRDPRWWPEPDRFDPDRFDPANRDAATGRPRYAYFPFGGGSRLCVGESFAWAEAVLVLAVIAGRWRLRLVDSGPLPLEPGITLRPGSEVRAVLRRRAD